MLSFLQNGNKKYIKFCGDCFLEKDKKLADAIKQTTVPQFLQKHQKALTEDKHDAVKSSLKRIGRG